VVGDRAVYSSSGVGVEPALTTRWPYANTIAAESTRNPGAVTLLAAETRSSAAATVAIAATVIRRRKRYADTPPARALTSSVLSGLPPTPMSPLATSSTTTQVTG
jgi:hypothetical protein